MFLLRPLLVIVFGACFACGRESVPGDVDASKDTASVRMQDATLDGAAIDELDADPGDALDEVSDACTCGDVYAPCGSQYPCGCCQGFVCDPSGVCIRSFP